MWKRLRYLDRTLIVALTAVVVLASCNFRQEKNESRAAVQVFQKGQVDFAMVKEQVLTPRCQGCHSPAGRGSEFPLGTFEEVQALIPKIRETVFEKRSMPPAQSPQLTASQNNILSVWLDDGGPEKATRAAPQPVDVPRTASAIERPVRWAFVRAKVFEPACFSCHGAQNPEGITNLDDLEEVRSTIGTTYYTAVVDMSMPPKKSGLVLSIEQKDILSFWITDGMLD